MQSYPSEFPTKLVWGPQGGDQSFLLTIYRNVLLYCTTLLENKFPLHTPNLYARTIPVSGSQFVSTGTYRGKKQEPE